MKIVYRVTEEDFIGARDLFFANEKPWYRRITRRVIPWLGGFLVSTNVALIVVGERDPAVLAPGFILGFYFLYCGLALRQRFRRAYKRDQRYLHDFTVEISEEELHFVTPTADSRLKWNGIVRFLESDKLFMLFIAEWNFIVLPKRAFAPGEADQFHGMLCRKVQASK